jgi:SAM-dependent methyltransferase
MFTFQRVKNIVAGRLMLFARMLFPDMMHKSAILRCAASYDMYAEEDEGYYAKVYLHFITERIKEVYGERRLSILDAGCGQGRLSIPLASKGHDVVGFDLSPKAIESAQRYAADNNVGVDFRVADITSCINTIEPSSFDCVICTEVLYMLKEYKNIIAGLCRVLRPGGLLFLSIRSKYFYLLRSLLNRRWDEALVVCRQEEGYLSGYYFNWHTSNNQIESLLRSYGISQLRFHAIGICSGIADDPLSSIARPALLKPSEQNILFDVEVELSQIYNEVGRYTLVSGVKDAEK